MNTHSITIEQYSWRESDVGFAAYVPATETSLKELVGIIHLGIRNTNSNQEVPPYVNVFWLLVKKQAGNPQLSKYQRVGKRLMQVAIEYSFENLCQGRVQLLSYADAVPFYYSLHMRCEDEDTDLLVTEAMKNAKGKKIDIAKQMFVGELMYLPEAAVAIWQANIIKKPILERTKEAAERALQAA